MNLFKLQNLTKGTQHTFFIVRKNFISSVSLQCICLARILFDEDELIDPKYTKLSCVKSVYIICTLFDNYVTTIFSAWKPRFRWSVTKVIG